MDFSPVISGADQSRLTAQVDAFNKTLGREIKENLDKDDFLKILLTQLTHQDPTQPMEDKEFIAQMAQFSTLEQMTNLSTEFSKISNLISAGQAMSVLGKSVELFDGETMISGKVEQVRGTDFPQILVNGTYYDYSAIQGIRE